LFAPNWSVASQGYFLKSTVDAENWAKVSAYRLPSLENRRGKGGFRIFSVLTAEGGSHFRYQRRFIGGVIQFPQAAIKSHLRWR